jgi:hypothetical protein
MQVAVHDADTSDVVLQPRQLPGCTLHLSLHAAPDTLVPALTHQGPSPFVLRPASVMHSPSPFALRPANVVHSPQNDELLDLSLKLTAGFARRCASALPVGTQAVQAWGPFVA